jgi:phage shock protein E
MKKKVFLSFFALFLLFSYTYAQNFKSITADELKKMMDKKTRMVLVDARTAMEYGQGYIPTAINVPPEKMEILAGVLPKNKKEVVVFYCRGVG